MNSNYVTVMCSSLNTSLEKNPIGSVRLPVTGNIPKYETSNLPLWRNPGIWEKRKVSAAYDSKWSPSHYARSRNIIVSCPDPMLVK